MVVQQRAAHAPDCGIGIDCNFDVPELVPLLGGAEEVLVTVLYPFHRSLQERRAQRDHHLFRVAHQLRPEPAADLGRYHAHGFIIAAEQVADYAFYPVRALRGGPQGESLRGEVTAGERAPAFHGVRAAPVQAE